ncbi:hypothetical protein D9M71_581960 [compost metagenome]
MKSVSELPVDGRTRVGPTHTTHPKRHRQKNAPAAAPIKNCTHAQEDAHAHHSQHLGGGGFTAAQRPDPQQSQNDCQRYPVAPAPAGLRQGQPAFLLLERHSRHPGTGGLQRQHRAGLAWQFTQDHHRRPTSARLRPGDQAAPARQPTDEGPAHPRGLEAAAILPQPGAYRKKRKILDRWHHSGGNRCWQQ